MDDLKEDLKMYKLISAFCFIVLATLSLNTSAALIQYDWQEAGDNSILFDDVSGLEWLNLTETLGKTYNYIESQLAVGGIYEGFRYATLSDVQDLTTRAGIIWGSCHTCSERMPAIENFMELIGPNYSYATGKITSGMIFSDHQTFARYMDMRIEYVLEGTNVNIKSTFKRSNPYENLGSFLVRTASVPEPGTLGLLFISLVSLAVLRRRQAS